MADNSIVIVGAGLAGAKTAEHLRDAGFTGPITVIGNEEHLPYDRPPLSKDILLGKAEPGSSLVHDADWYATRNIEVRLGSPVLAIDTGAHQVTLANGDILAYGRLVIATGSRTRSLNIPGADLAGVLQLRTVDDAQAILRLFANAKRIAIIGGGWIGLEVAAAARAAGIDVTILEAGPAPLINVLGPDAAAVFERLHTTHGVEVRTNVMVEEFVPAGDRVGAVKLGSGEQIPVDGVIVGIGILPNVEVAAQAGLATDNGIVVDEHLRTSDPDVFAVGDVANAWHPVLDRRIRVEHWANALNQPAVAAQNLVGGNASYDRLPYFYTDQYDLGMEYVGYAGPDDYDDVVFRGDREGGQFQVFWLSQGRVLAGMSVNIWDAVDDIRELILTGRAVDPQRLADPGVALGQV